MRLQLTPALGTIHHLFLWIRLRVLLCLAIEKDLHLNVTVVRSFQTDFFMPNCRNVFIFVMHAYKGRNICLSNLSLSD